VTSPANTKPITQRPPSHPPQPPEILLRVSVTLNTVGAGQGHKVLWETKPPVSVRFGSGPSPWVSEQETAVTQLKRNLEELDSMCRTGFLAVRLQVLVCEPIPRVWTDWMDSMVPSCGEQSAPFMGGREAEDEERPSPIQVVVVASAQTAAECHNLKSAFTEKRMQDVILALPYLSRNDDRKPNTTSNSVWMLT